MNQEFSTENEEEYHKKLTQIYDGYTKKEKEKSVIIVNTTLHFPHSLWIILEMEINCEVTLFTHIQNFTDTFYFLKNKNLVKYVCIESPGIKFTSKKNNFLKT